MSAKPCAMCILNHCRSDFDSRSMAVVFLVFTRVRSYVTLGYPAIETYDTFVKTVMPRGGKSTISSAVVTVNCCKLCRCCTVSST